jgi:hypothetical protein
MLEVDFDSDF